MSVTFSIVLVGLPALSQQQNLVVPEMASARQLAWVVKAFAEEPAEMVHCSETPGYFTTVLKLQGNRMALAQCPKPHAPAEHWSQLPRQNVKFYDDESGRRLVLRADPKQLPEIKTRHYTRNNGLKAVQTWQWVGAVVYTMPDEAGVLRVEMPDTSVEGGIHRLWIPWRASDGVRVDGSAGVLPLADVRNSGLHGFQTFKLDKLLDTEIRVYEIEVPRGEEFKLSYEFTGQQPQLGKKGVFAVASLDGVIRLTLTLQGLVASTVYQNTPCITVHISNESEAVLENFVFPIGQVLEEAEKPNLESFDFSWKSTGKKESVIPRLHLRRIMN